MMDNVTWTSTKNAFVVKVLHPTVKRIKTHPKSTTDLVRDRFIQAIDTYELRKKCKELNDKRDEAYSYKVEYFLTYCYVNKEDELLGGSNIAVSYEMGHCGLKPAAVKEVVEEFCNNFHEYDKGELRNIRELLVNIKRGNLIIGGCPEMIKHYKSICHPSVCVCNGDRREGNLCHHWFIDTLLGGDTDIARAHPMCKIEEGKVKNMLPTMHTIATLVDDIVWGREMTKRGLSLYLTNDPSPTADVGMANQNEKNGKIDIIVNRAYDCPKCFTDTVLHECAHARSFADYPLNWGEEQHGHHWVQRMLDIQKLLACRLDINNFHFCARTVNGHIKCQNCNLCKETSHVGAHKCPDCSSRNIITTQHDAVYVKQPRMYHTFEVNDIQ